MSYKHAKVSSKPFERAKVQMRMTEVLDRGDTVDEGCGVVDYEYAEAMDRAVRSWKWEVIAMINKFNNLRYYTDYTESNETVYIQVQNPNTGNFMTVEELCRLYDAMSQDACVERLVPNYKDMVCQILEQEVITGPPVQLSEFDAALPISLGCDTLDQLVKNQDMFLRDDKVVIQKMSMLGLLYNQL